MEHEAIAYAGDLADISDSTKAREMDRRAEVVARRLRSDFSRLRGVIKHRMTNSVCVSRQRLSHDRRNAFMKTSARAVIPLFCGVLALVGLANPPFSYGGEITYTWHSDPNSNQAFGMLVVNDIVLSQGVITLSDVESFSFVPSTVAFDASDLSPFSFPIPISTIDAIPSSQTSTIFADVTIEEIPIFLNVEFSSTSFAGSFAAEWDARAAFSHGISGSGYWTVMVPEPSSVVLASLGCVWGIAYVRGRWLRR